MLTGFGQAKKELARFMGATQLADPGAAINTACEELATSDVWKRMLRSIHLIATNQYFALPQQYESLIRACVDGQPVTLHGSEIEFLLSGPGDFDFRDYGMAPLNGIEDLGVFPTMYAPAEVERVCFFSTTAPATPVLVQGIDDAADLVHERVQINQWSGPEDLDSLAAADVPYSSTVEFSDISSVTLPLAAAYISMYGITAGGEFQFLARMHPSVQMPQFRRYRLPGFKHGSNISYKILGQVRNRFMPLVEDTDIVPFETLLPVQYMILAIKKAEAGELKISEDYRGMALAALMRREVNEQAGHGLHVENTLYDQSPGALTDYCYNL